MIMIVMIMMMTIIIITFIIDDDDDDQAPDNMPLYVTVAATFLYFVIPFTIVLFLYLR